MADNQPTTPEEDRDPEWERIQKITPGLETETTVVVPKEEEVVVEPEPVAEPVAPVTEDPVEPEPAAPVEEPVVPAEEPQKPQRPERYIPVAKYTAEKKEAKERIEALEAQLATANALEGAAREDAITTFATENGVPEESVRDLVALIGSKAPEAPAELDEALQKTVEDARIIVAEKAYETDFNDNAVPTLRELFPEATDKQLKAAQSELEKIACSKEFLSTPLEKVVLASQKELAPLFAAAPPARKGPEDSRQAALRGTEEYTADDFKGGKTSFEELFKLSGDKQATIVEAMDVKTYEAMTKYANNAQPQVLKRGGTKVEF